MITDSDSTKDNLAMSGILIYILIILISVFVYYLHHRLTYWKRRGIPHDPPHFPEGNLKGFKKTHHIRDLVKQNYDKYKHTGPFGGFYFFLIPSVVIYDLDLIRNILIKDFHNFCDRRIFHNERDDPLTGNLLALRGSKWKNLRAKLSPSFSSGKMKSMLPTIMLVADKLIETVDHMISTDPVVEVKDILARFTVDVIATCAFGIDCNSLTDPDDEFRLIGAKALTQSRHSRFVNGFIASFPELAKKLRMRYIHEDVHQFYMRVVRETVEFREKNNVKRNDFMNLLIELKNSEEGLTIEEIAAQSFLFFLAGFETSSTTMGFALYELALHQDIQDKLRAEINEQFEKNGGKLTYDSMSDMHYIEKVLKETLRKHSVATNIGRNTINDYPTSVPKYIIPKGTRIVIPIDAIHRDPEIYPDPERFDPERFSPEEIKKRHPLAWLPFGEGPRNCIGLRFGKMQTFAGLSMLLRRYKFHCCDKTPKSLEPDVRTFTFAAKGGIYLRLERV